MTALIMDLNLMPGRKVAGGQAAFGAHSQTRKSDRGPGMSGGKAGSRARAWLLLAMLLLIPPAWGGDRVVVIVNSANTQSLTLDDIKNIYTGKVVTWKDGEPIAVYDLPVDAPPREVFSRQILGLSPGKAAATLGRHGRDAVRAPAEIKHESLVVAIVSKKYTAIGYCSEAAIKDKLGIRVVATLN